MRYSPKVNLRKESFQAISELYRGDMLMHGRNGFIVEAIEEGWENKGRLL